MPAHPPAPADAPPEARPGALRGSGWAVALPVACGIHCLLTPVLVSVLPFLGFGHELEWAVLALSGVLVVGLVIRGRPHHGRTLPLLPAVLGIAVWAGSLLVERGDTFHAVTAAVGGVLLAAGALWNGWLLHRVHCRASGTCLLEEGHVHG